MSYLRPDSSWPGANQRGAALVIAMLVFAMCTALIVAMKGEFTRLYQRTANIFLAEQAYAYLRGAEELAGIALKIDYEQDLQRDAMRDDLREIWAQPTAPYALDEGGWLIGSLEDLQGRFNLNHLAGRSSGEGLSAGSAQFVRLLQALDNVEVSEQDARLIAAAVADWLDVDGEPGPNGVEDDFYFSQTPAYRAANRPMASVSELRAVAYMTPEIYRALQAYVTVWPATPAPLNIHTAPVVVLRSINADGNLAPLPAADAEALAAHREESGFADLEDFFAQPTFDGIREGLEGMSSLLGQHSTHFLLSAQVEVADRNLRLYSVLQRRDGEVVALARANGSL